MPVKPKTKPQPVSEDAPDDSVDDVVRIEFNGATFEVPKDADDWSTEAYLARIKAAYTREPHDWMRFLELVLGPRQWALVTKSAAAKTREYRRFVSIATAVIVKECTL